MLEEPRHAYQPNDVVHAEVGVVNPRVGQVHVLNLTSQRQVMPQKPMHTAAGLQVKFECPTNVRVSNPGRRHPGAAIQKWNPASPGRKIIPKVRRQPQQPLAFRLELAAPK